ncbi:uncharacterized protein UTRI_02632_B [Ustilago trichophora]|uniref:Uncharacterized protein n=1 Tax=Ustilago trichophora TaxID=86804 RepID=A0A5C3E3Y0_9BASI|nr:uncharacterized protein UTRI_02632_B [Ustilago trichophora]
MVPAPLTTGCTINGTDTGNCCNLATISTFNNMTTCQTSQRSVDQLRSCLFKIVAPFGRDYLACNFDHNNGDNGSSTNSNSVPLTAKMSTNSAMRAKMGILGSILVLALTVIAQST